MMEGLKVRCHTCGMVLYETTDKYTCHKPLSGDMLRLLPLYKDWPCYDGSLAVSSTSRFLMFCSQCAGYIANPVGGLRFADFYEGPHVVSQERSNMGYGEVKPLPEVAPLPFLKDMEAVDDLILPYADDSALSDDLQKVETPTVSPEDLINEMKKQDNTSRSKRSRKGRM